MLRLQQEFLEYLEQRLGEPKSEENPRISEEFANILEEDIIQSYNECKERHAGLEISKQKVG